MFSIAACIRDQKPEVATQLAKLGQAVQAGQPLLSVLPGDGKLEGEPLVPSRAIGFIEPGDQVLLRYQAFPHQKFGHRQGRVVRISRSALSPGELGSLIGDAPGMLLEADILGERRRLIEWVFEPLYSLKGRLQNG